jgi:hypothetical protein
LGDVLGAFEINFFAASPTSATFESFELGTGVRTPLVPAKASTTITPD